MAIYFMHTHQFFNLIFLRVACQPIWAPKPVLSGLFSLYVMHCWSYDIGFSNSSKQKSAFCNYSQWSWPIIITFLKLTIVALVTTVIIVMKNTNFFDKCAQIRKQTTHLSLLYRRQQSIKSHHGAMIMLCTWWPGRTICHHVSSSW